MVPEDLLPFKVHREDERNPKSARQKPSISAKIDEKGPLTRFAYEPIPNKTIIECEIHGAAVSNAQSGSLGALARGAK
jgi:hypothetical protein